MVQFGISHAGCSPANVHYAAGGNEAHVPSRAGQAVHQFDFLEIKEKSCVEQANLSQGINAQHHARARDPFDDGRASRKDDSFGHPQHPPDPVYLATAEKLARDRREAEGRA